MSQIFPFFSISERAILCNVVSVARVIICSYAIPIIELLLYANEHHDRILCMRDYWPSMFDFPEKFAINWFVLSTCTVGLIYGSDQIVYFVIRCLFIHQTHMGGKTSIPKMPWSRMYISLTYLLGSASRVCSTFQIT